MVVIVWWLNLQLPVQSVPITTNVMSSNPAQEEKHIDDSVDYYFLYGDQQHHPSTYKYPVL
jgi:hypothetical protein